jgi:MtN3 and saliva related transmembrane protein
MTAAIPAAIDLVGYAAALLTTAAFAPQVFKSFRTGSVRDLSGAMLAAQGSGNLLWLAYGVATDSAPLAAANALTFALVAALGALKLRERRAPVATAAVATPQAPGS